MTDRFIIDVRSLEKLLDVLKDRGYRTLGPKARDGAIVYEVLGSVRELPLGVTSHEKAGCYRLARDSRPAFFAQGVGMQSWKRFLHPPDVELCSIVKTDQGLKAVVPQEIAPSDAFIGVRPCDLNAIALQDRVLMREENPDAVYRSRRQNVLIVAVNCTEPGGSCFCASMNSGPEVQSGYDLALTEIMEDGRHCFLVQVGSNRGADALQDIPHKRASNDAVVLASRLIADATRKMGRWLDTHELQALLYGNTEHPHWEQIASRCLSCGNCTFVCPTCFCTTVEDSADLAGTVAVRRRRWSSCYSLDFSYIHNGAVRASAKARHRHWVTHKFGAWVQQFGTSGCVGCGRCITWCPVGIDVTEELRRLRMDSTG